MAQRARRFVDKRVVVTGGAGFLGSRLVAALAASGHRNVFVARHRDYDLASEDGARRLLEEHPADLLFHLAAVVGGIGANRARPGTFCYENLVMGAQLLEQARLHRVEKIVTVGTICAYPRVTPVPFNEADLWSGYPEPTNAPYGLAKKMQLVLAQAYREQYGLNTIHLLPTNLYGPGDHFEPDRSHVIPALIRRCLEATRSGRSSIEVWGTGAATREFLFVDDAAEALCLAAERYDGAAPINVGVGREISIRSLVALIAEMVGFEGRIEWRPAMPDGQPRRLLDCQRAKEAFGFEARTSLRDGLRRTIAWYVQRGAAGTPPAATVGQPS